MALSQGSSSVNLVPNKPDSFDRVRDILTVNTWVYLVEQFLLLTKISYPAVFLNDEGRITFASTFATKTAAVWMYTVVQGTVASKR